MSFQVFSPKQSETPIIVSVPHAGTRFPDELIDEFDPTLRQAPDDTDWFIHELYDFVCAMGIPMITATYSRWVIDLNRDPQNKPLYTDGRIITSVCPTTTFLGQSIYRDHRTEVSTDEVARRTELYFTPYHQKLSDMIEEKKNRFGKVLLWDSHSIRQFVPTIQASHFPDFILGDADGKSASSSYSQIVLSELSKSQKKVSHNHPFKGGYITRHYGCPEKNQHTLQLEMTKINYMNDTEETFHHDRAQKIRLILTSIFEKLMAQLS